MLALFFFNCICFENKGRKLLFDMTKSPQQSSAIQIFPHTNLMMLNILHYFFKNILVNINWHELAVKMHELVSAF